MTKLEKILGAALITVTGFHIAKMVKIHKECEYQKEKTAEIREMIEAVDYALEHPEYSGAKEEA
jgi:hypothetical protein